MLWLQFNVCFLQNIESLEAQLNDAFSDRRKATESISSLQVSFMIMSMTVFDMFQGGGGRCCWVVIGFHMFGREGLKGIDNHILIIIKYSCIFYAMLSFFSDLLYF